MKTGRPVKYFSAAIGALITLIVTFLTLQATHLNTRYSVREFFPKNLALLDNDYKTEKLFSLEHNPTYFVVLALKPDAGGSWLQADRLDELERVTNAVAAIPGLKNVRSLANLDMAIETKGTLDVGPIQRSLPSDRWEKYVGSHALLDSQLISRDRRSVLLSVETTELSSEGMLAVEEQIQAASSDPSWEVSVGGVPAVQAHFAHRVGSEIAQFLALSLLLFCLMFFVFYRNLNPVIFAGFGLLVTNLTSIGWINLFGVSFTVLLSTLPIIVSIAFVSITVHTLHLWADRLKTDRPVTVRDRFRASLGVLRELALPNFLGSLTTSIGFLTLATADVPAIRTYALAVSAAVVWTWFMTQIILIGFQHYLNPVPREWNHARAWWMLWLNRWSLPIIGCTLALSILSGATVPAMNFSGRLFDDLPRSEPVRKSTENLDQHFGGTVAFDMAVRSNAPEAWKDPARLRRLATAMQEIRRLPGMGSAIAVTDFLERIPAKAPQVAEVYFLFSLSSANPLKFFVTNDSREVRVMMRLQDVVSEQVYGIRNRVAQILAGMEPGLELRESGVAVNSHIVNQEVAKDLVYGFWQSLVLIGLLLVIIFRSFRWAVMACVPNLIPPAILIGTLVLFQTPVKPGIALVFSIALGLAFNNTVYLLSRLKREQTELGMNCLPLRRALLEEGNPCFSESFIMLTGFLIFLTSEFKVNQIFGAYMILSILAGALADLVFLPAILRRFSFFLWDRSVLEMEEDGELAPTTL